MSEPETIEITTAEKLAIEIHKIMVNYGLNIIDSIVEFCDKNNIEMEDAISMLGKTTKDQIRACAIEHRYVTGIPKKAKLP